mmetsp:Transcript_18267/g.36904  ORF Transcript_18267/g.36904 Transcript_18267/m.36904 type:complete len:285 (+) Transcript_18267:1503-2357(+)
MRTSSAHMSSRAIPPPSSLKFAASNVSWSSSAMRRRATRSGQHLKRVLPLDGDAPSCSRPSHRELPPRPWSASVWRSRRRELNSVGKSKQSAADTTRCRWHRELRSPTSSPSSMPRLSRRRPCSSRTRTPSKSIGLCSLSTLTPSDMAWRRGWRAFMSVRPSSASTRRTPYAITASASAWPSSGPVRCRAASAHSLATGTTATRPWSTCSTRSVASRSDLCAPLLMPSASLRPSLCTRCSRLSAWTTSAGMSSALTAPNRWISWLRAAPGRCCALTTRMRKCGT